jgi:alkaline phosphatase
MKIRNLIAALALAATVSATALEQPRYVFYFIGDGMGMGPIVTAETYNRMILKNDKPLTMMQFPTVAWCMTYSASSPITDSAAAGTALSTGTKTRNAMLGMAPDTTDVTSIARILKDKGYGVGVATSVAPDDATPGAFYAHVPNRSMYYEIGCQAATSGYDFLCGAGLRGVKDKAGKDTDLLKRMADNKVQIVRGPAEIKDIKSDKVFLLNTVGTPDYNIGYTIDSLDNVLTLPLITETCLKHLQKVSPDRFFMMIEGGNIDHALHANDGGAAIKEIINFNEALQIAYDFYLEHPDETLIVVTADHDTGGMALGNTTLKYAANLQYFDYQKVSKEAFSEYCKGLLKSRSVFTWADMKEYLTDKLGFFTHVPVTEAQETALREKFDATFELRNTDDQKTLYANFNAFAVDVFRLLNDAAGVGFTTMSHAGNAVPLFAVGVGSEQFTSFNNNCEIPRRILNLVEGKSCGGCCEHK